MSGRSEEYSSGVGGSLPRAIRLEGCRNFRDLGGYPTGDGRVVRWRRVFRSDALHQLTPADVMRLRDDIGVRDVIDLRSTSELQSEGRGLLAAEPIRFHHLPLYDGEARASERRSTDLSLADRYFFLSELGMPMIARILALLARSSTPVLYHCAAGKDRTGLVSAIVLGVLGVPDEVIAADYALTRENLDAILERLWTMRGYRKMLDQLPPDTLHAEPETMLQLLARLRSEHGSLRGYALAAGAPESTFPRMEARLLEEA